MTTETVHLRANLFTGDRLAVLAEVEYDDAILCRTLCGDTGQNGGADIHVAVFPTSPLVNCDECKAIYDRSGIAEPQAALDMIQNALVPVQKQYDVLKACQRASRDLWSKCAGHSIPQETGPAIVLKIVDSLKDIDEAATMIEGHLVETLGVNGANCIEDGMNELTAERDACAARVWYLRSGEKNSDYMKYWG